MASGVNVEPFSREGLQRVPLKGRHCLCQFRLSAETQQSERVPGFGLGQRLTDAQTSMLPSAWRGFPPSRGRTERGFRRDRNPAGCSCSLPGPLTARVAHRQDLLEEALSPMRLAEPPGEGSEGETHHRPTALALPPADPALWAWLGYL